MSSIQAARFFTLLNYIFSFHNFIYVVLLLLLDFVSLGTNFVCIGVFFLRVCTSLLLKIAAEELASLSIIFSLALSRSKLDYLSFLSFLFASEHFVVFRFKINMGVDCIINVNYNSLRLSQFPNVEAPIRTILYHLKISKGVAEWKFETGDFVGETTNDHYFIVVTFLLNFLTENVVKRFGIFSYSGNLKTTLRRILISYVWPFSIIFKN